MNENSNETETKNHINSHEASSRTVLAVDLISIVKDEGSRSTKDCVELDITATIYWVNYDF